MATPNHKIEVFFDGACPLCKREIALVRWADERRNDPPAIKLTDIAADDFNPADYDRTLMDFHEEILGRTPSGEWLSGVEVFRRIYAAIGLGWLAAPTRWALLRPLTEWGYSVFARNRIRWTGRCKDDLCRL